MWSSKASELGFGDLGASSETKSVEKPPPDSADVVQKSPVVEGDSFAKSVDSAADLDGSKPAGVCLLF